MSKVVTYVTAEFRCRCHCIALHAITFRMVRSRRIDTWIEESYQTLLILTTNPHAQANAQARSSEYRRSPPLTTCRVKRAITNIR